MKNANVSYSFKRNYFKHSRQNSGVLRILLASILRNCVYQNKELPQNQADELSVQFDLSAFKTGLMLRFGFFSFGHENLLLSPLPSVGKSGDSATAHRLL
jgi:hypothetical protein